MSDLIQPTKRRSMTKARRVKIFLCRGGIYCLCGGKIHDGDTWTIEHLEALSLGGADHDDNCAPAHERCRRLKDKDDAKAKAKRDRIVDSGYRGEGRKRSTFACSRDSRWKKKISGEVVRRDA